jgi:geranylgeranyl pyrophosphate synthase
MAVEWEHLSECAERYAEHQAFVPPLSLAELHAAADDLLMAEGLPPNYHEFLLVLIHNAIWRDAVAAIPFERRTLLLPPCLRPLATCKAEFDELGLLCRRCGACDIGRLSIEAEKLGYAVLVAEGTSIVASLIDQGMIDSVIGVSCMTSLEKSFPHTFQAAIPSIAVPLLREGCEDTMLNAEWVRRVLHLQSSAGPRFLQLNTIHEAVQEWFTEPALETLLGGRDTQTEKVALQWLAKSGKRWRPFLAVAVYLAMQDTDVQSLPDSVRRVAIALECIHKASLIYDDIQDDDTIRYGDETVHRVHGIPVALTASLYLLGQGYRLIADSGASPEQRAAMTTLATQGHCELCRGQGSELWWMQNPAPISVEEVLEICRLKTGPSFEVVFRLGAMCANASAQEHSVLQAYSEAVGMAYQVQDDLADFRSGGDVDDVESGRPSVPFAVAYQHADPETRDQIAAFWTGTSRDMSADALRELMRKTGAEEKTRQILEGLKEKARQSLTPLQNPSLKILLYRILAKILPEQTE